MYMPLHVDDSQSRARKVSRSEVALLDEGDVGGNHLFAELLHRDLGHPAELLLGLGRVSDQQLDLGRPEVLRVDPHQDARLVRRVDADLVDALALPLDGDAHGGRRKGELDEVANRVCNSRRHDVVVRLVLLHHHPHHLDVVAGVAPVALCVNVAHVQCLLQPLVDPGHGASDLPHLRGRGRSQLAGRLLQTEPTRLRAGAKAGSPIRAAGTGPGRRFSGDHEVSKDKGGGTGLGRAFRVTKVGPRRGDSWLNRIPLLVCIPYASR
mmetsp:Transcript_10308/g.32592  ORF Transcript_10308/g.32592 Transcript_10308/m.32592 type:complete len:266 (-) Transcript_10308:635-1432(-)